LPSPLRELSVTGFTYPVEVSPRLQALAATLDAATT
jgi:hypothetical protein